MKWWNSRQNICLIKRLDLSLLSPVCSVTRPAVYMVKRLLRSFLSSFKSCSKFYRINAHLQVGNICEAQKWYPRYATSVQSCTVFQWRFDTDPDPRILATLVYGSWSCSFFGGFQDANKNLVFQKFSDNVCLLMDGSVQLITTPDLGGPNTYGSYGCRSGQLLYFHIDC